MLDHSQCGLWLVKQAFVVGRIGGHYAATTLDGKVGHIEGSWRFSIDFYFFKML